MYHSSEQPAFITFVSMAVVMKTNTYNYPIAKWLEEKLKNWSPNAYTISDIFQFSKDIINIPVETNHPPVSYDKTALFTNDYAHEIITILVKKAFKENRFNDAYNLNSPKTNLQICSSLKLLTIFFNLVVRYRKRWKGVAKDFPLAPVLAIIVWPAPRTGKMNQILCCDWLPERARSLPPRDYPQRPARKISLKAI